MAANQHKPATAVTLAPLAEKSAVEQLVDSYWKHAVVLVLAIVGVVVVLHRRGRTAVVERRSNWERLLAGAGLEGFTRTPSAAAEELESLAGGLKGSEAEVWAHLIRAQSLLDKRDFASARKVLETLRQDAGASAVGRELWLDPDSSALESAFARLASAVEAQERWQREHPTLFTNPEPSADSPRVRISTDLGNVTLTLHTDRAPKHVANFLDAVAQGYFNGTKFSRVAAGQWCQGGDPNTKLEDVSKWDAGDPARILAMEPSTLFHFEGTLSAPPGKTKSESLGGAFTITAQPQHSWDGERVAFGTVVEGLDLVRRISEAPLAVGSVDRPAQPVTITTIERL